MPPPRPRVRRTAPRRILLLFCGVFWIALCWSYVLFSLWSSLPRQVGHGEAHYSSLPPNKSSASGERTNNRRSHEADFPGKQNRHLSSSPENSTGGDYGQRNIPNDDHHHLRANDKPTLPGRQQQQQQASPPLTHQSAPPTHFVYPLHAKSGTHHAYLYVGTPPQRQTLIVDTGSRLTAFPCHPHCPDCGTHASAPFRLNASSSHEVVPCDDCQLNHADFELEEYFEGDGIGGYSGDDGPPALKKRDDDFVVGLRGATGALDRGDDDPRRQQQRKQRRLSQRLPFPNSCVNDRCGLDQRYTEGSSWRAFEVRDKVWLGSESESRSAEGHSERSALHVFGCQVSETGLFKTQYADGIMGLSMYTQTLVGTWKRGGSIPHPSFSLCLNRRGGHIALGGTGWGYRDREQRDGDGPGSMHLTPMKYTPFAKENVWYYTVRVTSISVGDHVLPQRILQFVNDRKGTIVDSGTTDTFISHMVSKPFVQAWEKITGRKYNNRLQKYTHEQFNELPTITFELEGGILWEITPEAYMEEEGAASSSSDSNGNNNGTTVGNGDDEQVNGDGSLRRHRGWEGKRGFISRVYVDEPQGVVLGSNAMMDKEIFFDVPNKRLGVARATCAY